METPNQSTKLFFTCGMRTRTLFDVIMKCKDKNCKLEESVLKKDTCNFDTPLFLHCIGLESSIKCVSACAGVKIPKKYLNFILKWFLTFLCYSAKRTRGNNSFLSLRERVLLLKEQRMILQERHSLIWTPSLRCTLNGSSWTGEAIIDIL